MSEKKNLDKLFRIDELPKPPESRISVEAPTKKFKNFANQLMIGLQKYNCSYRFLAPRTANAAILITPNADFKKRVSGSEELKSETPSENWVWRRFEHFRPTLFIYSQSARLKYGNMPNRKEFQTLINADPYLQDVEGFLDFLAGKWLIETGNEPEERPQKPRNPLVFKENKTQNR